VKSFIVYNKLGEILRTGKCADNDLQLQAGFDESVMEGVADDSLHIIVDGNISDKPPPSEEEKNADNRSKLRAKRDSILKWCDWTQVPDSPLSESDKIAWRAYRQELRDLPQNYPENVPFEDVVFPNPPN
jgi:hypothetical protein